MGSIYPTARLAEAVSALAARVEEPEVRTQLAALGGIIGNLDATAPDPVRCAELERAIDAGIQRGDEAAVCAAMVALADLQRRPLRPLDWSAASGD